jgi:hypothetical protein
MGVVTGGGLSTTGMIEIIKGASRILPSLKF